MTRNETLTRGNAIDAAHPRVAESRAADILATYRRLRATGVHVGLIARADRRMGEGRKKSGEKSDSHGGTSSPVPFGEFL